MSTNREARRTIIGEAGYGLALVLLCVSCSRPEASSSPKVIEVGSTSTADDLPAAVKTTLSRATQNHPMTALVKTRIHGKVVYETTAMIGTTTFFIRVAEDGKLLERKRVEATALPPPP